MNHQLIHGDCMDVLPTLTGIDAVITDPPYLTAESGIVMKSGGVAKVYAPTTVIGNPWGYSLDWVDAVAVLEPKQWIVYCNSYMLSGLIAKLENYAKFGTVFVWRKSNAPLMTRNVPRFDCEFVVWAKRHNTNNVRAGDFKSQVLDVPMPQAGCFATERIIKEGGKAAHPTQKPLKVVRPFVRNLTERGWCVLDPFMGTGTTGVAAIMEGRKFIGIEKDAEYFDIAQQRVNDVVAQPHLLDVASDPLATQGELI